MSPKTAGIRHVTAIAGAPRRNVDFYEGVLGLRLVKKTVNFDDPGTYHLYYGDEVGTSGTVMTFFPWPGAPKGRRRTGQVAATAFSIPRRAVGYSVHRLIEHGVALLEWTARSESVSVADGADSFFIRDGLVVAQTIHYTVESLG